MMEVFALVALSILIGSAIYILVLMVTFVSNRRRAKDERDPHMLGHPVELGERVAGSDWPYTSKDMYDQDKLPDMMFRLLVNRGLEPTIGLRLMALDLANLSITREGKFPSDMNPPPPSPTP